MEKPRDAGLFFGVGGVGAAAGAAAPEVLVPRPLVAGGTDTPAGAGGRQAVEGVLHLNTPFLLP